MHSNQFNQTCYKQMYSASAYTIYINISEVVNFSSFVVGKDYKRVSVKFGKLSHSSNFNQI